MGHEHYDIFGLIDMNGRVYDPVIGRFLSPDPFIQAPGFTQSYNSYSYCFNNPLSLSDPSGYSASDPWTDASWFYKSLAEQQAEQYGESYYDIFSDNPGGSGGNTNEGLKYDGKNWTLNGKVISKDEAMVIMHTIGRSEGISIDFQGDSKLTIGVQAGGNVGGFGGQYGIFGNLFSVTLIGNEGKKLIYPTSQKGGFTQINQGLSGGLIIGAGVSHTFDGSFEGYGYANDSYSYLGWLSNKKGIFGITYIHSAEGNSINIGISLQIALILGFEGSYNLRIKW